MNADPTLDAAQHGDAQGARDSAAARVFEANRDAVIDCLTRGQDAILGDRTALDILRDATYEPAGELLFLEAASLAMQGNPEAAIKLMALCLLAARAHGERLAELATMEGLES